MLDGSLLSSQSVEEDNDVLPGLQLVAAEAQGSTDEIGRFGGGDEVVAIEELQVVGEDDAIPGGCTEDALDPSLLRCQLVGVAGGGWYDKVDVVVLQQLFVGFVETRFRSAVGVGQRVPVDEHGGAVAPCLSVIDPADDGDDMVVDGFLYQAVFAVEVDGLWVVLEEEVVGVDDGVFVAEEAKDALLLFGGDLREAVLRHLTILLDQRLGDNHLLDAVLAWVLERPFSHHVVLCHGGSHLEGGVDADAVEAVEHLRVHASHGGANDQVGTFALHSLLEQGHCLCRMDGEVGCQDRGTGHELPQHVGSVGGSCGEEAVDIEDLFPFHQGGVAFGKM